MGGLFPPEDIARVAVRSPHRLSLTVLYTAGEDVSVLESIISAVQVPLEEL
jgi:hypothetical protein